MRFLAYNFGAASITHFRIYPATFLNMLVQHSISFFCNKFYFQERKLV